jgi:hypothetical protein
MHSELATRLDESAKGSSIHELDWGSDEDGC